MALLFKVSTEVLLVVWRIIAAASDWLRRGKPRWKTPPYCLTVGSLGASIFEKKAVSSNTVSIWPPYCCWRPLAVPSLAAAAPPAGRPSIAS